MLKLFQRQKQNTSINSILKNDECKKLLEAVLQEDLPTAINMIFIIQQPDNKFYVRRTDIDKEQLKRTTDEMHFSALKEEL